MRRDRFRSRALMGEVRRFRLRSAPLVVGGLLVVAGVSGLLDDSGLVPNPPWIALLVGVLAFCSVLVGRTVRALRSGDSSRASVEG